MSEGAFEKFLEIVSNEFPEKLTVCDDSITLKRKILFIKPDKDAVVNVGKDVIDFYNDDGISSKMLDNLLGVLDVNLGTKYTKVSEDIYDNKKPWKVNKLKEMKSSGLIYVCYYDNNEAIQLFLSFMVTEEDGLYEEDPDRIVSVIYLYEIQLLPKVRRQKLGQKLLYNHLYNCGVLLLDSGINMEHPLQAIELTVFSDNEAAIKFYKANQMRLTPLSPLDTVQTIERRKTRNSITREPGLKIVKKPIYYLFYLTFDEQINE